MSGRMLLSRSAQAALLVAVGSVTSQAFGQYQASVLYQFTPPAGSTIGVVSFDGQQQIGFGSAIADGLISGTPTHAVYWDAS
jgi:hypothetical protein